MSESSIFRELFRAEAFVDRYANDPARAVDLVIPVINTNELWERNLQSFYREIPIRTLLLGDGGCTDETVEVARRFPRVVVLQQQQYRSQGFCIRKLIEEVETEWFIYLHADVYLPPGWFDTMCGHQGTYDWYECSRRITVLFEYVSEKQNRAARAYSGSQMGRKAAFDRILNRIDDDYLQRNEDIIFQELVEDAGFRTGRVDDTVHHHQMMNRRGETEPDIESVAISRKHDAAWERRIYEMQVKGLVKYTQPHKPHLIGNVQGALQVLSRTDMDMDELLRWVEQTNPAWLPHVVRGMRRARALAWLRGRGGEAVSLLKRVAAPWI